MATYLLTTSQKTDDINRAPDHNGLGSAVLVHNVRWFIRVRWFVVTVLILAGLVSLLAPTVVTTTGLILPHRWPWILAAILAVANLIFWALSRRLTEETPDRFVRRSMWFQIVVDLVVMTVVVHFVGSTTSFISFIYLLHVVLACMFFSTLHSFVVTLMAVGLYLLCVGTEILGFLPPSTITPIPAHRMVHPGLSAIYAVSAVLIWFVVWYMVATLSKIVGERGRLLEAANQRLTVADKEKNRLVLRTTHDLKAPFSGIESNIQVLKLQYWDQIPDSVKDIVNRIEARGKTLSDRIRDILLLSDLRTMIEPVSEQGKVDMDRVLKEIRDELDSQAQERRVSLRVSGEPIRVEGNTRHFFILFSNLIANAISYSLEGGVVDVSVRRDDKDIHISVKDDGIGIDEKSLPLIFDEYFRTKDAAQFNQRSTGLGLAIVKEIAQKEGLRISVSSEVGKGSVFDVAIPVERCEFRKDSAQWPES